MTPLLLLMLGADPTAAVGRSLTVTVTAPAAVEAQPQDDRRRPLVVQSVTPADGGYRVTLYGLDPGRHALADVLRRTDGQPLTGVQPEFVEITSGLPPGHVPPAELPAQPAPRVGGYRTLLTVIAACWVVGMVGLVASFFLPRRRAPVSGDRPLTLADRLRPLVAGAAAGTLKREELAALERALVSYWRGRLGLNAENPHAALRQLHADPQAGPLLAQLEAWLHQPVPTPPKDVGALLAPYRALPPDAVRLPG